MQLLKEPTAMETAFETYVPFGQFQPTIHRYRMQPLSHQELARIRIESSASEGATVLDPFMGSGTVGAVCKKIKRNIVGIELNPEYCSASLARLDIGNEYLKFATDRKAIRMYFSAKDYQVAK